MTFNTNYWLNFIVMICLVTFTAIYNYFTGFVYVLMVITITSMMIYFVTFATKAKTTMDHTKALCEKCNCVLEMDEGYSTIGRCKNAACVNYNLPMFISED